MVGEQLEFNTYPDISLDLYAQLDDFIDELNEFRVVAEVSNDNAYQLVW